VAIFLDNDDGTADMSLQSLYLTSSLVARVKILSGSKYIERYPFRYAVRHARITTIYRHLLGPDSQVRPGDLIDIVDKLPVDTGVFAGDPPLDEGSDLIAFLSHPLRKASFVSPRTYIPTMPRVSKIVIDTTGLMYVAGSTNSAMSSIINAHLLTDLPTLILGEPSTNATRPPRIDEQYVLHSLLSRRGVLSQENLRGYAAAMTANPRAVIGWAYRHNW
jgi:hypothetical protein